MKDAYHRILGHDISASIQSLLTDIKDDDVGLWQIAPVGSTDFDLSGADLLAFISLHVSALLDVGARPYKWLDNNWIELYAEQPSADVVECILRDYLNDVSLADHGGIWFRLVEP